MKYKIFWPLFLIVLIAALLRFGMLSFVPPSLNWDEVSHGWNAYSILKTGHDEWGVSWPVIFRAFGDYKLPVYIYLTAISESIFGLSAFSVRFVSALSGVILVITTFFLTKRLLDDPKKALLASLLVALEPWSLFMSRSALEANLAVCFITAGVYFFVKGITNKLHFLFSALFLGLSLWTYNSARVFVPLLIISLIFIYKHKLLKNYLKHVMPIVTSFFIFTLFFVPMVLQLVNPVGQARYGKVAIVDNGSVAQIEAARLATDLPPLVTRAIYNRPVYFMRKFVENYVKHFSFNFLYTSGGTQYNYSVPNHGLLYAVGLPFFIYGIYSLIKKRDSSSLIILSWLLLSPIASAFTREAPHVLRASVMLPTPMIVTAVGLVEFINMTRKRFNRMNLSPMIFAIFILLIGYEAKIYVQHYITDYRTNYSESWQYGYSQVVEYAKEHYADYDKIIVTKKYGEPHIFFLYFWPWSPSSYATDTNLVRYAQSEWFWVDRFDKFYFVNDWDVPKEEGFGFQLESGTDVSCEEAKCLLVTSPDNHSREWQKVDEVDFLDGGKAFELYEN